MTIKIIRDKIRYSELKALAAEIYADLIKGVVDIRRELIAVGGEMHSDSEEILLNDGSRLSDLWGFNIYFDSPLDESIAYESFINIRPRDNNRSLEVEDPNIRKKMKNIILEKIENA